MPIYEYELCEGDCKVCGGRFTLRRPLSAAPLKQCPSCKKQTLKKLVSAPVFRLKGGGWYETDFKSDQEGKRNLAAGEEAAESASSDKPADDKAKPVEASQPADKNADKKPAVAAESRKAPAKKSPVRPAARSTKARSKAKPKPAKRAAKRRR